MINIIGTMLIMNHFAASVWYFIARLDDFNDETWVVRKKILHSSYFKKYVFSFYWSF